MEGRRTATAAGGMKQRSLALRVFFSARNYDVRALLY